MGLAVRLLRALFLFAVIFTSYMVQLGLARWLKTWHFDPLTRTKTPRLPKWIKRRRQVVDKANARRLLHGMLKLRGVYIKLGQVLSIMGGFLPRAFASELESLQDQVPPHPFRDVEKAFLDAFGKAPDACFRSIERTPLAAASLGQVHVAYLDDGTKVAVKVLYPGIRDIIKVDMRVLSLVIRVYKWFVPVGNLESVHASLVDLLRRETDYLHEAACMDRLAKNFKDEPDIAFPSVIDEWTTKDILTMTFMEGVKITRFDEIEKLGIDRTRLAGRLVQTFYKQLFVDRFFHADPHPGNFLVQVGPDQSPRIVVLDFGAISEVNEELVEGGLEILQAVFAGDGAMALRGFKKMGFVSKEANTKLLEETVMTYFKKLLRIQNRTVAALMRARPDDLEALANPEVQREELRELMRSIQYPDGWFYVERASVLMFWLCGQIAPELDTMSVGLPYVLPLIMQKRQESSPSLGAS